MGKMAKRTKEKITEQEALAALQLENQKRIQRTAEAINKALKDNNTKLIAYPKFRPDGTIGADIDIQV
jgi:hypothetical protein